MKDIKDYLILISGGGTGGPSTAPLALALAYKQINPKARFVFVGNDPFLEKELFGDIFQRLGAEYYALPAGKWRRYFSVKNFLDIFKIIQAFFCASRLLHRLRPDLIISAGSFASVPLAWAGRLRNIKILVHQQDVRPGLANRLMAPIATKISVAFPKSLNDYGSCAVFIGNPSDVQQATLLDQEAIRQKFGLNKNHPFLLVTGGGRGALKLNYLFYQVLDFLPTDWQIIHQTGVDKSEDAPSREFYNAIENISHADFKILLSLADLVLSRAGLGIMTELSLLGKVSVLLPIPRSHQEDNAAYFQEAEAAIVLDQDKTEGKKLADILLSLWQDTNRRQSLSTKIKTMFPAKASEQGAQIIQDLLN
jgi:UDP-N-acetylglucosamine--N-acetylmuramyl-(pentapeptide) pyrophosphoryl-undecaprenol N-acetylglucosamine transferase